MITTPITLHRLDDEHAIFVGSAEETLKRSTPFGEFEFDASYPAVWLQHDMWENMGRPTTLMLKLELPSLMPDGL